MKITRIQEITVVENFVDTDYLFSYAQKVSEELWNLHEDYSKFWNGRILGALDMDVVANNVVDNIREKVKYFVQVRYHKPEIYSDVCQIARWTPGFKLKPHADAEYTDDDDNHLRGVERKHPFYYRQFASVIYLNDNFLGGETFFPNQDFVQKPKAGTLVVFPCTKEYLHGVTNITEGVRYTCPSWYTQDKKFNLDVRKTN